MMEIMITNARLQELKLSERTINQRREWHALRRVERLERALRVERARMRLVPAL